MIAYLIRLFLMQRYPSLAIFLVDSIDEAMQRAFGASKNGTDEAIFVIGGTSYWRMVESGSRIRAGLPDSGFILLDDHARPGCGMVVDRLPIQGYVTRCDSPADGYACLEMILSGGLYVSPCGEEFLEIDAKKLALKSRSSLRQSMPFAFSEREWDCFHLLISGYESESIAEKLSIKDRSARNLKYRIMKKMGVRHFVDVLRTAHQWGLFDS